MDTGEKPKRIYKKHKEGFKISVEHRLNTKLKTMHFTEGHELSRVYVEVIAKRKRQFFPSVYDFYVNPNDFEAFKGNDIVQSLLKEEVEKITQLVENWDKLPPNLPDENKQDWLTTYKFFDYQNSLGERIRRKIYGHLKALINDTEDNLNKVADVVLVKLNYFKGTLELLTSLSIVNSNPLIKELIDVLHAYLRIKDFLSLHSKEWLYPDINGVFYIENSIKMSLISNNEFITNKIKSFGPESDAFFVDLNSIKLFLSRSKNV